MPALYTVLGGQDHGVYSQRPELALGKYMKPLPIVIQCPSQTHANKVYQLERTILHLPPDPSPQQVIRALEDAGMDGIFLAKKVYAVVFGHQTGIYYDWDGVEAATKHFPGQKQKGFSDFGQAVKYWIMKGKQVEVEKGDTHFNVPGWAAARVQTPLGAAGQNSTAPSMPQTFEPMPTPAGSSEHIADVISSFHTLNLQEIPPTHASSATAGCRAAASCAARIPAPQTLPHRWPAVFYHDRELCQDSLCPDGAQACSYLDFRVLG
ncbi:hypothetical protein A0H81_10603 [Grifola frondosa]|uniref:Ribonuclease H1 N-terminal domain-containing protein n=1 Tax=Grifola frondosa TaxID=5627 RepID=A0A1C7LXE6_GRIFR|nr:hypothetical protein A0H81_10603 [Grifola frondosa]